MMFKSINGLFFIGLLFPSASIHAIESDIQAVTTNPVVVTAERSPVIYSETSRIVKIINREEIISSPVKNIADLLEFAEGVDVRQRGTPGAQADITIRGGTFDQALVLLNGMPINDPQTGHHNLNLPLDVNDISRIEILQGSGARVLGSNSFSGAINIITQNAIKPEINLSMVGGDNSYYKLYGSANYAKNNFSSFLSAANQQTDGYMKNTDLKNMSIYSNNSLNFENSRLNLQLAYNNKEFGANSFYSAKYPDQFEETRTAFASIGYTHGDKDQFSAKVYFRGHQDRFELFRNQAPAWYSGHNYHLTALIGTELQFSYANPLGNTVFGTDIKREKIYSNVLGKLTGDSTGVPFEDKGVFTRVDARENISLFVDHTWRMDKLSVSGGIMGNWNSMFKWDFYFGMDLNYKLSESVSAFASVNQSNRLPNFTDLYYQGPTNIGNPNLKPEKSINYETGVKYIDAAFRSHTTVFLRHGEDLIDWIKYSDKELWQTQNLTELNTYGFEESVTFYPNNIFQTKWPLAYLNISYTYMNSEKSSAQAMSLYALDYLRHKIGADLGFKFFDVLNWSIKMSYQERTGSYYSYSAKKEKPYAPTFVTDTKLSADLMGVTLFIEATNLLDRKFADIANIPQAGRWIFCGFNYNLKSR